MKESIEMLRAERIFEEILDGDMPVYDYVDFSDIIDSLDVGRYDDDYEIETHINKCFLNVGYEWVEVEDNELALIKPKESEVVCVVCDGKGYLTDVYDTEAEETQIQRCDSCKQFESDEQAQEHVERVVESTLSDEEEKNLVKRLEQIEREQIIAWGLHRISGGFVKAEFDYVEDDRIYISLTDGVKSDCEDRVNISHCSLWRSNLEWTD